MSSKVVLDLKAAIGSLKLVSNGSFRPAVDSPALDGFGFETAAKSMGDDENNRELTI